MTITIIGTGLIGGSMAMDLKAQGFADHVIGVDHNQDHLDKAIKLGIIDSQKQLTTAVRESQIIILAVPVDKAPELLLDLLDHATHAQTIIDVGSTKSRICNVAAAHQNRELYVAAHPIAGTEFSGPSAAHHGLFKNKVNIICDRQLSGANALSVAESLFASLQMRSINMDSEEHDKHIAYVSHLSHISSFMLGLTVLNIEKDEKNIFNMAGSGFESTVRLAKSSPDMWAPIFKQNEKNVSLALGEYIHKLIEFKKLIDNENTSELGKLMTEANDIKRVLNGFTMNKNILETIN